MVKKNIIICPYCSKEAKFCENKEIYGRNIWKSYMCYYCKDCDAYVWTHNNTRKPLWTLANKELRELRRKTHSIFDRLWKEWNINRWEAYIMLAKKLNVKEIHIWQSDKETCEKIIKLLFLKN